jgi:hypothetical protein
LCLVSRFLILDIDKVVLVLELEIIMVVLWRGLLGAMMALLLPLSLLLSLELMEFIIVYL